MNKDMVRSLMVGVLGCAFAFLALSDLRADEYQFVPGWSEGDYWVIRSPRWLEGQELHGTGGALAVAVEDGSYLTRFWVQDITYGASGVTALIKIHWKVDTLYEWGDEHDYYTVRIDLARGKVIETTWHLRNALGEDVRDRYRSATGRSPATRPFHWPHGDSTLPDTLYFEWPVLSSGGSIGAFSLASIVHAGQVEYDAFVQTVLTTADGAEVTYQEGGQELPLVYVFTDGLPWYEVRRVDSAEKINEIIEVGNEPVSGGSSSPSPGSSSNSTVVDGGTSP